MTSGSRARATVAGVAGALVLVAAPVVFAQDRMPPIPDDQMTEAQREAIEEFKAARDTTRFGGPFVPLLRSPEMLSRARNVGDYVRFNSALPPRLSEFVILLIAREWTQQTEWAAHAGIAERAGLHADIIGAVAEGRRPDGMAVDEAAVYDFCIELLRTHGVSDPTYARLVSVVEEKGVVDTIGIMGYYSLLAMVMNTARTPLAGGAPPPLQAFPR
ncbi:MAG TPA: carboxymuconolactone decarboxylase family protein [Acidobacteria bacterium]|nr:carboxymuconolactone decarboxylase family protein [Acidobacteriota bacterium]